MNMPRLTAEASLYQTNNHYCQFAAGGSVLSAGNTTVTLQACGWFKGILCSAATAAGSLICYGACITGGPAACYGCWAATLAVVGFTRCYGCIPEWMRDLIDLFEGGDSGGEGSGGGGGGTPETCCERNEWGRCIVSVPKGAECP